MGMRGKTGLARIARRIARPSLTLTLFLTGCVALVQHDDRQAFDNDTAAKVFAAGYSTIQDKYINPVSSRHIAANGLSGLTSIDANLTVAVDEKAVHLLLPDGAAVELPAPADGDAQSWGAATANAIAVARIHSKAMSERSSEELYQAVFKASLVDFDRFSRYLPATQARSARASRDGYGGIGVLLHFEAGLVQIDSVMPESPAAKAGLKKGDTITQIDHVEIAHM